MSPETQQLIDQAKRGVWDQQIIDGLAQAVARGEIVDIYDPATDKWTPGIYTLLENLQPQRLDHIQDQSLKYFSVRRGGAVAGTRGLYAGAETPHTRVPDARFMPDQLPRADLQPQREPVDPVTLQPQLPPVPPVTLQPQLPPVPPVTLQPQLPPVALTMQDWTLPGESSDILPDFDTSAGVSGFAGQPAPEILPPIAPGGITGDAPEYGGPGLVPGVGVGNDFGVQDDSPTQYPVVGTNDFGVQDDSPTSSWPGYDGVGTGVTTGANGPEPPFNYYDQPVTDVGVGDDFGVQDDSPTQYPVVGANDFGVQDDSPTQYPVVGDEIDFGVQDDDPTQYPVVGAGDGVTDPPVDAVTMSPETQQLIDQAKRGVWNPQIVSGLAHAVARGEIVDIYTALENLQPQRLDHIRDQSLQISLMEEAGYVDTPIDPGADLQPHPEPVDPVTMQPQPPEQVAPVTMQDWTLPGESSDILPDEIIPDEVLEGPVVVGTDPIGNAAAGGGPPPESEGDVFDYAPPENTLMPQLQGVYQTLLDTLTGKSQIPGMEDIMGGLAESQREEAALNEQLLALRGVSSSSGIGLADDERERLGTRQRGETAQRAMDVQGQYMQNALMPLNQIFAQGSLGRQQSLNEFLSFLDRQFNRDDQQTAEEAQAIALMLNAMGLQTISPQMPSFTAAQGQPGFNESFMNLVSTLGPSAIERWG